MDLNIFIILFTLFTGGNSLICYKCNSVTGSCVNELVFCPSGTKCASITSSMSNTAMNKKVKGCAEPQNCASGSINFGNVRSKISAHCCNNYLCNSRDVPDYTSDRPNGKQCYYCDGISCFNKLDCLGTEDHCITTISETNWGQPTATKGCASKLMCEAGRDLTKVSCCQGNLCNTEVNLPDSEENQDTTPLNSEENLDTNPLDSEENLDRKEDNLWDNVEILSKKENLHGRKEKLDKEENLHDHEERPHNSERILHYSERNVRNSAKSITQNLLFLFGPFLSYIIYY